MNKIEELIKELKEKGDTRWEDLTAMMAKVDKISISTPLGALNVSTFDSAEGPEIWVDLVTNEGSELAVAHFIED